MKRTLSLLSVFLLLFCLLGSLTVCAAGSITLSASKSTVTVGSTVTVTAKCDGGGKGIGSLDAYFRYNAKVLSKLKRYFYVMLEVALNCYTKKKGAE